MATPRHELKYFISIADAPALESKLERALLSDSHGDDFNEYNVRSLYFDDLFNSAYHDKIDGVRSRDKYRIRIYGHRDSEIFLERKRKMGDLIAKDDVRITKRLAEQLIDGNPRGLETMENPLLQDMFVQMRTKGLRPKVLVDYERTAFQHIAEHVRVTFDKRVRTGGTSIDLFDPDTLMTEVLTPGLMVLEVKYDRHLPDFIPPLLSSIPAQRAAISKYTLCRQYSV